MKYSYRKVVRRGKKDGRNWKWKFWPFIKEDKPSEPKPDQVETAPFEEELFQLGENEIAPIVKKWKEIDEKLKPRYCIAKKEDDRADIELERLTEEKKESFEEYKDTKEKLNKFTPPSLDKKWEFIFLVVIGISEFFINSLIFQLFGEDKLKTNLFALGIGVIIPLLAYWLGHLLKQQYKSTMDKVWLIVIPISVLGVLEVISVLRAAFFEGTGIVETLHLNISETQFTIGFFIINIVFFIGAVVISYFASHPQGDIYKQAKKLFKNALEEFKEDEQEVKDAAEEAGRTENSLGKITHFRAKTHEKLYAEAMMIKETIEWLIKSYKAMNLRHRPDFPPCFKKPHQMPEIPIELTTIDWNCNEDVSVEEI